VPLYDRTMVLRPAAGRPARSVTHTEWWIMSSRIRRSLLLALAGVAVAATAGVARPAKPDQDKAAPPAKAQQPKTWSVSISPKGKGEWLSFGVYSTAADAKAVEDNLKESGWDTKVEVSAATVRPVPRVMARAPSGRLPRGETITLKNCTELFTW